MNADLFYLLALQQASRGCKRCISPPVPLSCVILMVLKVDIAMAAIEMPMAMNRLGLPGIEISIL